MLTDRNELNYLAIVVVGL